MINTLYIESPELLDVYIEKSGLKIGYIVGRLGISRQGFRKKKLGINSFRASEVFELCDLLRISAADKEKIFCFKGKQKH